MSYFFINSQNQEIPITAYKIITESLNKNDVYRCFYKTVDALDHVSAATPPKDTDILVNMDHRACTACTIAPAVEPSTIAPLLSWRGSASCHTPLGEHIDFPQ